MSLVTDPALRRQGLMYLDPELAGKPATHVLLIGVGTYVHGPEGSNPKPGRAADLLQLTSPPISARRIANWFLTSFQHGQRPLGSLAVLASPFKRGTVAAHFKGTPRPTEKATTAAVLAWYDRAIGCRDNTIVFYVCGHGTITGLGQTMLLLEDCGSDARNDTRGTLNLDRLHETMVDARIGRQLFLIDCCRNIDRDRANPVKSEPAPILAIQRAADDDGMARLQAVIFGTSTDKEAAGRVDRSSVFADALLTALGGPALNLGREPFMVTTDRLAGTVQDLQLWRSRDGDAGQKSATTKLDGFDLHQPVLPDTVATFVTMRTPKQWEGARVTVAAGGKDLEADRAPDPEDPLVLRLDLPPGRLDFVITRPGKDAVRSVWQLIPPARFVRLDPDAPPAAAARVQPALLKLPDTVSASSFELGQFHLRLTASVPAEIMRGAVARLQQVEEGRRVGSVRVKVIPASNNANSYTPANVEPGTWQISVTLPSGEVLSEIETVAAREAKQIVFQAGSSPREWLGWGHAAGLVRDRDEDDATDPVGGDLPQVAPVDLSGSSAWSLVSTPAAAWTPSALDTVTFKHTISTRRYGYSFLLASQPAPPAGRGLAIVPPGPQEAVTIVRLPEAGSWGGRLPLRIMTSGDTSEPSSLAFVAVEGLKLAPVLGHVARGALSEAAELLAGEAVEAEICAALTRGREEPLVAVLRGLIAVATACDGTQQPWDQALVEMQAAFPQLPDASIVLARRLLRKARPNATAARNLLLQAWDGGLPVFSLAMTWMAEDLARFDDDAARERSQAVRRTLQYSVPRRPFTTLRLPR